MSQNVSTSVTQLTVPSARSAAGLPWGLAWSLAVGQFFSWGVLYYAFIVVVGPLQMTTSWSRSFINGGISLGLLVWGVGALPVGAWIQRRGGRGLMTAASLIGGLAFCLMGAVPQPAVYLLAWMMIGVAMAGLLYEPAFAVVTAAFGADYRRGISLITLVGGLASTLFVPLSQFAVERFGWQNALVGLGMIQILVGVPLRAWRIPRIPMHESGDSAARPNPFTSRLLGWGREIRRDVADPRFIGLALWFTAHAAAFTGLIFHLVPILQARGVADGSIVKTIALIGPLQVLGRFVLTAHARSFSTLRVGRYAMAGLVAAMLILILFPPSAIWLALFAVTFGAANGISTILRGTAGALCAPSVLAKAAAPLVLAQVWIATDRPQAVLVVVLAAMAIGGVGLYIATCAQRGHEDLAETDWPQKRTRGAKKIVFEQTLRTKHAVRCRSGFTPELHDRN